MQCREINTENMAAVSCILRPIHWPQAVEITWLCSCVVLDRGSMSALLLHIVSFALLVIERRRLYVPMSTDSVMAACMRPNFEGSGHCVLLCVQETHLDTE